MLVWEIDKSNISSIIQRTLKYVNVLLLQGVLCSIGHPSIPVLGSFVGAKVLCEKGAAIKMHCIVKKL